MGAFVVSFLLAAYWARTRPKAAATTAACTEALLLLLMGLPKLGEPVSVWYVQIPVGLLLLAALGVAFRKRQGAVG